ncbi:MAG TPA: glycerophosphodiester phosphodiesterase family protein [Thermoanaerobaculia bacterium]|nr:glycerophosphodiester phosphodiesterase family protein [Thermoanaerobaculia bacterium]
MTRTHGSPPISIIAHRGMGQGHVDEDSPPENTLPAFEAGWASGASACELDVQLSRDGKVIVIHDDTTNRTANAKWRVAERSALELASLDAGGWKGPRWAGIRIPLLSDVLAAMPSPGRLVVELKDGIGIVDPTAEVVCASCRSPEDIVFISFNIESISAMKRRLPEFICLLLVELRADHTQGRWIAGYCKGRLRRAARGPGEFGFLSEMISEADLDGIDLNFAAPRDLVDAFLREGRIVVTWTINDPSVALELASMGVAGITTDRPAMIRDALHAGGFQCK